MGINLRTQKVMSWLIGTYLIMPRIIRVHFAVIDVFEQFGRFHQMPGIKRTNSIANNLSLNREIEFLRGLFLYRGLFHFGRLHRAITGLTGSFLLLFLHVRADSISSGSSQPLILRIQAGIQVMGRIHALEGAVHSVILTETIALAMIHISMVKTVILIVCLIIVRVVMRLLVVRPLESIIIMVIRSIALIVISLIIVTFWVLLVLVIPGLLAISAIVWVSILIC